MLFSTFWGSSPPPPPAHHTSEAAEPAFVTRLLSLASRLRVFRPCPFPAWGSTKLWCKETVLTRQCRSCRPMQISSQSTESLSCMSHAFIWSTSWKENIMKVVLVTGTDWQI
jgi:hypothetical protein